MELETLGAALAALEPDPVAAAMKALTFAGVVASALGVATRDIKPAARSRCLALGSGGVVLMFANMLISAQPGAVLVDAAYAAVCVAVLVDGRRQAAPAKAAATATLTESREVPAPATAGPPGQDGPPATPVVARTRTGAGRGAP